MLLQMLRKSDHQFGDYLVMMIVVVALASIFEAYDSGVDCYQHDEEGQQSRLPPPAAVPLSPMTPSLGPPSAATATTTVPYTGGGAGL